MTKSPELTQKPTDLVRDYLKKLHDHVIANLKSKIGEGAMDTTPIEYIITTPAMWSDKAKEDTRMCAEAAGFGENIHMISEPEAAVTYALEAMDPGTLNVGDTFVLVDGGGGTGDLISYRIEDLDNIVKVKEAAPGTGALCGSSYLNQIFRDFLIRRFIDDPDWEDEILDDAMHKFEMWTKRHFRGEDSDFIIPVSGLQANPALGINKRGKLRLTLDEMIKIFEPVVTVMTTLIQSQINATKSKIKAVLLVGGFGQSPYLKRMVQDVVGPHIEVLQPADGDLAVVKGALIKGLAMTSPLLSRVRVSSRVARKAFGLKVKVPFQPARHGEDPDKSWDPVDGIWRVWEVQWLIKKGDILKEDQAISKAYRRTQTQRSGRFEDTTDNIKVYDGSDAETPPADPTADGIRPHVTLTAAVSKIPEKRLKPKMGKYDKKKYYELNYEIRINFFSAHTEYSLWFKDECYGKVNAKYE